MVGAEPKRSARRPTKGAQKPISSIDRAVPKENSSRPTCNSAETGFRKMPKLWRTPRPMARTTKPQATAGPYERSNDGGVLVRDVMPHHKAVVAGGRIEKLHAVTSCDVAQKAMMRMGEKGFFAVCLGLAALLPLASEAMAGPPRLERDRCVFRAPRGDRL